MFNIKKNKNNNVESFNNILNFAKSILQSDQPQRIDDLIYSLGKPYQFKIINMCIKGKPLSRNSAFNFEHLFFRNDAKKYQFIKVNSAGDFINYNESLIGKKIHPDSSLIFTFPWNKNRLSDAFNHIGETVQNEWKFDPLNHRVLYISPLNIGYVLNGNHSAVMNIINNEAPMIITEELDLTLVYEEIYTDGQFFKSKLDNSIIDQVSSVEFAAIFEIGRLLLKKL